MLPPWGGCSAGRSQTVHIPWPQPQRDGREDKLCDCQVHSVLSPLPSQIRPCSGGYLTFSLKSKGFLHIGSVLSAVTYCKLDIWQEQRANVLLVLFPCQESPVAWWPQQSDTSRRWWPIVNNPVRALSRQFSEEEGFWWRKGTGCYRIRVWLRTCGK